MNAGSSATHIRKRLLSIFEQVRQSPGAPYEPERLLAFLTDPPAPEGRRVADSFAGRRRVVRFMNAIQLESGICFTVKEWDRGFSLEELANLVAVKMAKPDQGLRLARQRLDQARRRRIVDPARLGLLTFPFLVVAGFADSWPARIAFALVWAGIVGGVAAFSFSEVRYSRELVSRIAARAEPERVAGS
ncbi:MAG TPA: hypothetical protein VFH26_01960 [Gemmatimonadales bacterium]|nr:hypothetical protein [Gemmatimonadales bacterium]